MTYTILFTTHEGSTAGIIIVQCWKGLNFTNPPSFHAHVKGVPYHKAFVVFPEGIRQEPIYVADPTHEHREVDQARKALQKLVNDGVIPGRKLKKAKRK